MYEIEKHQREIDERTLVTYSREIYSANVLGVECGTTGFRGGDTGHGCRTYLKLEDLAGTDMRVKVHGYNDEDEEDTPFLDCMGGKVELIFGGDCELSTLITALEFATKALKDITNHVHD